MITIGQMEFLHKRCGIDCAIMAEAYDHAIECTDGWYTDTFRGNYSAIMILESFRIREVIV